MSKPANHYKPDYVPPPGFTLGEALSERGMTQVDLEQRVGLSRKHIKQIIDGKAPITPETALKLERVLGIPARLWNNLEQNYRDFLAREAEAEALAKEGEWLKQFKHYAKMVEFKWVDAAEGVVERSRALLDFFGVSSPDAWNDYWGDVAVKYRKSTKYEPDPFALAAWLRQGELEAQGIDCKPFDEEKFKQALSEIRSLTREAPTVFQPELVKCCAACGVAVVFVPELPKTASGATRWVGPHKALLQLSLKYGTDDHLWFTFFHEAGHILLHRKGDIFIETRDADSEEEEQANRFAARTLIPESRLQNFLASGTCNSKARINTFARQIGIAPGIVVGQLQHRGHLPKSHCNDLKQRFVWRLK